MKFAFTIVKTRGERSEQAYLDYMSEVLHNNPSAELLDMYFETTRGLHCHGTIESPNLLGYSDLINSEKQRGWSVRLRQVYNPKGWNNYIKKDQSPLGADSGSEGEESGHGSTQDYDPDVYLDPLDIYKKVGNLLE